MAAIKTSSTPAPGKRAVPHRRLHREHPALYEKMGENSGRATQRAMTSTQYRISRIREFRSGTGGL